MGTSLPALTMRTHDSLPMIDSHIHLWPASEVDSLAWYSQDHPLAGQHSVQQYRRATHSKPNLLGFVFIETDRKHDLTSGMDNGSGWKEPLAELSWIKRIAMGQPRDGEGHVAGDSKLCLGMVLWAPLPSNMKVMEEYMNSAQEVAGLTWPKIKGIRYLLQDKPRGTMLKTDFIENVKLLGRRGLAFDVCVDAHRRGQEQMEDLLLFVKLVREGVPEKERTFLVLDHFCKPDMSISDHALSVPFVAWRTAMHELAKDRRTCVKFSGGFAEMGDGINELAQKDVCNALSPWFAVLLETFGPSRIMFGSDWPVCTTSTADSWLRWHEAVVKLCHMAKLSLEEHSMIFAGTAQRVYQLDQVNQSR